MPPIPQRDLKFVDPETGKVNPVAKACHARVLADMAYLSSWKQEGHAAAAAKVCQRFGHEPYKGSCSRCGAPAHAMRDQHFARMADTGGRVVGGGRSQ